jgi:ABC-type dipeptide/oligopeptide/nickel transport system permease subunit
MTKVQYTINIVLKAVAIGMAIPSIILLILDVAPLETSVLLLSIGLAALAVASLSETESREAEIE